MPNARRRCRPGSESDFPVIDNTSKPPRRRPASGALIRHAVEGALTERWRARRRTTRSRLRKSRGVALDLALAATFLTLAAVIFALRMID